MSLDNTTQAKDESENSSGGGANGGQKTSALKPPPEKILKCPRCDSPNTKFCYYNNYSLTQPRHFCKTCRRYWTKGGALRNVPIGGGCRKSKKTRPSHSLSFMNGDSSYKDSSLDNIGGLSLFSGLSPPAMDFQLNGLNNFSSSINHTPFMNLESLRFNFPLNKQTNHQFHGPNYNLASSIESMSSINQDLHWKLQQQRLSTLYGGRSANDEAGVGEIQNLYFPEKLTSPVGEIEQQINQQNRIVNEPQVQKLQPILFQNLEIPKPPQTTMSGNIRRNSSGLETEWVFDGNYAQVNANDQTAQTNGNYENESMSNWNNEIQGWNQFN